MKKIIIALLCILINVSGFSFATSGKYLIKEDGITHSLDYLIEDEKIFISLDDLVKELGIKAIGKVSDVDEKDISLEELYKEVVLLSNRIDKIEKTIEGGIEVSNDIGSDYVYVTEYGSKYHKKNCPSLGDDYKKISISEAKKKYDSCKRCNP